MKFGDFLFPDCRDPAQDGAVIEETLREAALADELGADVIWLAEHHFDGISVYADPIALAEQMALLDHLTKGRLIVGLGRGSSYNIYDYQGFGIDHHEAQARLDEAEAIMLQAWTGGEFEHHGRFWQLKVPMLRPRPYTRPHPVVIRGSSGDASLVALARQGRPFMMNVQSLETTRRRVGLYRQAMLDAGYDEAAIAVNLGASWAWRNVFVAASDAEAERIGIAAFETMTRARAEMRNRIFADTGMRIEVSQSDLPGSRAARGDG